MKPDSRPDFSFKCNAFLSDILFLFTDFEEARDIFGEESLENQIIEPEEIDDDTKRDAYLARYQGLIFSVSNACLQTLVEVKKGVERRGVQSTNTYYRSNFMRLSAINSRNLFNIRPTLLEINQPGSMDNYRIFTNFFEIDRTQERKKMEDDYETLLNGFKTLFPKYVLNNEQIQHAISEAQGQYDTLHEFDQTLKSKENLFSDEKDLSVEEYFNFREDDTIAIISRTNYSQNKPIKFTDNSFEPASSRGDIPDLNPINSTSMEQPTFQNTDDVTVRHCLEFEKVRLLYTNKIQELVVHHLIRGFNFKQFRKTEYAELVKRNNTKPVRDFLDEYRGLYDSKKTRKEPKEELRDHQKKEAFFALILQDPQISCQNALSKS